MKNQKSWKSFVAGMLTMAILFALGIPALAAAGKNITVYPGVNIYIDDQKLNPKDVNGNPVEVFVYNGTTYLPVRAVSEALGKPVQWEGSTTSVYVGKHTGDKPAVWLSDLDYFTGKGEYRALEGAKDNLGNTYNRAISPYYASDLQRVYKLNGQYSRLTGTYFNRYEYRTSTQNTVLSIYGDGELLFTSTMRGGIEPEYFNIDLTGILELKMTIKSPGAYWGEVALGDAGLWT